MKLNWIEQEHALEDLSLVKDYYVYYDQKRRYRKPFRYCIKSIDFELDSWKIKTFNLFTGGSLHRGLCFRCKERRYCKMTGMESRTFQTFNLCKQCINEVLKVKKDLTWKDQRENPHGDILIYYKNSNEEECLGVAAVIYPAESEPKKYNKEYFYLIFDDEPMEPPEQFNWADLSESINYLQEINKETE